MSSDQDALAELSCSLDRFVEECQAIKRKMDQSGESAKSRDIADFIEAVTALKTICLHPRPTGLHEPIRPPVGAYLN